LLILSLVLANPLQFPLTKGDKSIGAKMNTAKITFQPIGIIHTPFKEKEEIPRQPYMDSGTKGTIEIFPDFIEGLEGLKPGSKIVLIFNFHQSQGYNLKVVPYKQTELKGVFATRAPHRPNSIGLSIVDFDKIENNLLYISNIDMLDGTPLLDIKPFIEDRYVKK
jgi:tRNA (adenine37-N6)-methyltransferase